VLEGWRSVSSVLSACDGRTTTTAATIIYQYYGSRSPDRRRMFTGQGEIDRVRTSSHPEKSQTKIFSISNLRSNFLERLIVVRRTVHESGRDKPGDCKFENRDRTNPDGNVHTNLDCNRICAHQIKPRSIRCIFELGHLCRAIIGCRSSVASQRQNIFHIINTSRLIVLSRFARSRI